MGSARLAADTDVTRTQCSGGLRLVSFGSVLKGRWRTRECH